MAMIRSGAAGLATVLALTGCSIHWDVNFHQPVKPPSDPDAPIPIPAVSASDPSAWSVCQAIRQNADKETGWFEGFGIGTGLTGAALAAVSLALAADSTAANNSGNNGLWVGAWSGAAAGGAALVAVAVYLLNHAADDKAAYWATNAALAQMRGDYNAPPASPPPAPLVAGAVPAPAPAGAPQTGHPTREDMDWAACSAALKTIGTGESQTDTALAAALGAGAAGASKAAPAAAAPTAPVASVVTNPTTGVLTANIPVDPAVEPNLVKELQGEQAQHPALISVRPAQANTLMFRIEVNPKVPDEAKEMRDKVHDLRRRFPAKFPPGSIDPLD